jgi:uncharacterized membrane protein
MFITGYAGESVVRYIDSISPSICRYISNYLRQYIGFFIPPGMWLVLFVLGLLVGAWALIVAIRAKRFPA